MKISYGITVYNEADELFRLTDLLINNIDKDDEIIICVDGDNEKVKLVLENFQKTYQWKSNIVIYNRKLDGNFADHKNSVIEKSSGDYIFHIDADEYPHETLLQQLKQILEINDVDLVWIPRVNTIDGMTEEHIQRWGW